MLPCLLLKREVELTGEGAVELAELSGVGAVATASGVGSGCYGFFFFRLKK